MSPRMVARMAALNDCQVAPNHRLAAYFSSMMDPAQCYVIQVSFAHF